MTRVATPLQGYNNNVRYLGRTFHIQTEDSGTKYARIMTHLFIDGGRIVKSTRTEYGSVVGQPDMAEIVRRMMKDQHKNMFLSLRAGEFDEAIERVARGEQTSVSNESALSQVPRLRADSLPSLSFGAGEEAKTMPGLPPMIIESSAPPLDQQRAKTARTEGTQTEGTQTERTQAERTRDPARPSGSTAPAKRPSIRPRNAKSVAPPSSTSGQALPGPGRAPASESKQRAVKNRPSERPSRSIAVRPPTTTQEAIDPRNQSIFGEATASKQTLDEVILSFLEDDET